MRSDPDDDDGVRHGGTAGAVEQRGTHNGLNGLARERAGHRRCEDEQERRGDGPCSGSGRALWLSAI